MKPHYRPGRHSPINVWMDLAPGERDPRSVQIAMATSSKWAAAICEALNESDERDRLGDVPDTIDSRQRRIRRATLGLEIFLDYVEQPGNTLADFPHELQVKLQALIRTVVADNPPPIPPRTDPRRLLVISAASAQEARRFASENRVPFGGPAGEWIYPADPERLRGVTDAWLYVVGGAYPSDLVAKILDGMLKRQRLTLLDDAGLAEVVAVKHAAIAVHNAQQAKRYSNDVQEVDLQLRHRRPLQLDMDND